MKWGALLFLPVTVGLSVFAFQMQGLWVKHEEQLRFERDRADTCETALRGKWAPFNPTEPLVKLLNPQGQLCLCDTQNHCDGGVCQVMEVR